MVIDIGVYINSSIIMTGMGILLFLGIWGLRKQKLRKPKTRASEKNNFRKAQAEENLRIIRENRYEQAAYAAAWDVVRARQRKERVLPQVSLGEIIMHPNARVHAAINSKRVDLLVTDAQFNALIAIEIDGSGHYLADYSRINDEGKTLALRSAGIPLLRIAASHDNHAEIKRMVRQGLERYFSKKP